MSDDNRRQEDATTADLSGPVAASDDREYSLSVEEALARYEAAGLSRTPRSIQRYCRKGYLEARRVETEFGEKFLIKPESVDRHIAYILEVRPVATSRDLPRHVATDEATETKAEIEIEDAATADDKLRPAPTTNDMSQRYVDRLEKENEFLRKQVDVKDKQITDLSKLVEQSNTLSAGVQQLLTPLLGQGTGKSDRRVHLFTSDDGAGDNDQAS